MSTPIVPPRPVVRQAPPAEIDMPQQQPQVPPRPAAKQRGVSPGGQSYTQSPFNEKWDPMHLTKTKSVEPIRRPPSVSAMPGLGSEGFEYGEVQYTLQDPSSVLAGDAAAQTKTVAEDLKLHAPKPSLPTTSATAQVQAVTRTDSQAAAAHGIGRSPSQDPEALGRVRSRPSISRPESASSDRRRSIYDEGPADQGGFRVPINPLLGDVQAPSPAPLGLTPHHTGTSHDGKNRRHSSIQTIPPGAYGLHGHGSQPATPLDKDWYAKHPDQLGQEEVAGHGVYESIGSGRGAFALSSDDLNKIVRDTASRGAGFGTSGNVVSYPDEQIGYAASEQYSTKRNSTPLQKTPSNVPESPLRKASYPAADAPSPHVRHGSGASRGDSDVEDIHIGAPVKKYNKITGGETTMRETEDVKPYASHPTEENGFVDEHGYTVPILAGDEVAKEVGYENLQPAVSPSPRRGSAFDDPYRNTPSPHGSRPSSRPGSIHGMHSAMHHNLQRYISHHDDREHVHTPLEDVEEYEPLFPEDEDKKATLTTAERFKQRPDSLRHRFPSQDIWEDTPDSAMYEAEVSTPDLPKTEKMTSAFEFPEQESARKGEPSEEEKQRLIPAEVRLLKSNFAPHLRDDMPTRPGLQPRFPSQDIWEDSPDSQYLVATVGESQDEEPVVPQRPAQSRLGDGASSKQIEPSIAPNIPARPQRKSQPESEAPAPPELKKVPSIPDRPKPQVPARPAKKDPEELTKSLPGGFPDGSESVTSPPVPKQKPQVPARPAGSKIANLRSNFMSDLNQKLGLGPPKEKEKEPEPEPEEVKPLDDARKTRARGPQRRAPPMRSNAPARPSPLAFSMSAPQSMWSIDEAGSLNVAKANLASSKLAQMENSTAADAPMAPTVDTTSKTQIEADKRADDAPLPMAPALSTNTAGESTDPAPVGESTELGRAETSHSVEAVPASKQTTASDVSGTTLDRVESVEPTFQATG